MAQEPRDQERRVAALDAGRLLCWLRERLERPGLQYGQPPVLLGAGGEAVVHGFALRGAPENLSGLLVVRRLTLRPSPFQAMWESTIHQILHARGYPVPQVYLVEPDAQPLGSPFLIMDRLAGTILLGEVTRPDGLLARPARLPGLLRDALWHVPSMLADTQARLHAFDITPVSDALREAGFSPRQVSFEGRLDQLESTIAAAALDGLQPGLRWLSDHRPREDETALCHGDLVFTNVMVEAGSIAGVFDWSRAALTHPAYDVAGTLARLESPIPDVPLGLRRVFRTAQRSMARRYLREYRRRRPIDDSSLSCFGAFWILSELAWSGTKRRRGDTPTARVEDRWLRAETIDIGERRFRALTGISVSADLGKGP